MALPEKQFSPDLSQSTHRSARSHDTMVQLRADPAFIERLMTGIHDPERRKKIAKSLHDNKADMERRKKDVVRLQDEKPLPKVLREIIELPVEKQNFLIAQAYVLLVSDPTRRELLEFLTQVQTPKAFGPMMQGFLLMAHAYDMLQSSIRPHASTMRKVRDTIHEPRTKQAIFLSLRKRKRIFYYVNEFAEMRFPKPTTSESSTFISQAMVSQRETDRNYFLFGAALGYNLHLRMETMRCKTVSSKGNEEITFP